MLKKLSPIWSTYLSKLVKEEANKAALHKVEVPATVKDDAVRLSEVTAYQGKLISSFFEQNREKIAPLFFAISTVEAAKEGLEERLGAPLSMLREKDIAHLEVLTAMCVSLCKQVMGRSVGDEDALKLAIKACLLAQEDLRKHTDAVEKMFPNYITNLTHFHKDMPVITREAEKKVAAT